MKLKLREKFSAIAEQAGEIRLIASSLAYFTLLSIFPLLILVLSVFQYVGWLEEYYHKVQFLVFSHMREAAGSAVSKFLRTALENVDFGTVGISGAIFLVWASLGLIRNIDYAFNRIWKLKIQTAMHKRLVLHWIVLVAVPLALGMFILARAIFFSTGGRRSLEYQVLFAVFIWFFLFALFKLIPVTKVKTWAALVSSAASGIVLFVLQKSFLWVSMRVFSQNKIYGSLASFPIFLLWLLAIWYVVLFGVALCAFLQQKGSKRS